MYSIGYLSRATRVKIPTIRYYEQKGLLNKPERSTGNQRRYSKTDLKQLNFIKHARDLGLSMRSIKQLIQLSNHPTHSCATADQIVNTHLKEIRIRLTRLKNLEKELSRIAQSCNAKIIAECNVMEALWV